MEPLEPPPTDPDTSARDGLVDALLGEAAFSGWTRAALATAASGLGLPEGEADRLFPGGPGQVLAFASRRADLRTVRDMEAAGVGRLKIRERIRLGVRTRLETHGGAPEAVRRALAFLALPTQAGLGLKLLYDTVDAIWYAAGDTSADFNFYTKRAILGGVLSLGGAREDLGLPRSSHRGCDDHREGEGPRQGLDVPGDGARRKLTWPILRPGRASALP